MIHLAVRDLQIKTRIADLERAAAIDPPCVRNTDPTE